MQFQRKYPKTPLFIFSKRGPLYFSEEWQKNQKRLPKSVENIHREDPCKPIFRKVCNFHENILRPHLCIFKEGGIRVENVTISAKTIFKMSENIHRWDSYLFSENLAKEMYQIGRFVFVIQMNYQTS